MLNVLRYRTLSLPVRCEYLRIKLPAQLHRFLPVFVASMIEWLVCQSLSCGEAAEAEREAGNNVFHRVNDNVCYCSCL